MSNLSADSKSALLESIQNMVDNISTFAELASNSTAESVKVSAVSHIAVLSDTLQSLAVAYLAMEEI